MKIRDLRDGYGLRTFLLNAVSIHLRYRYIIFEKMLDPGPDPLEKEC
jgi:hypothetical protein